MKCAICNGPIADDSAVLFSRAPGEPLEEGCPGCVAEFNYLAPYLTLLQEEETAVPPEHDFGARPPLSAWRPMEREGPKPLA